MASSAPAAAAARLQDLLRNFLSTRLDSGVKKLVPDSNGNTSAASFTVAMDAAEMLSALPFYSCHLQPSARQARHSSVLAPFSSSSLSTAPLIGASCLTVDEGFEQLLFFVGSVVELHVQRYIQEVAKGPSLFPLDAGIPPREMASSETTSANCSNSRNPHNGRDWCDDDGADAGSRALRDAPVGGYGGPRVNFVAWVALEVYRHLMSEAETRLANRRARGGAGAVDAAVHTDAYLQWEQRVREGLATALQKPNKDTSTAAATRMEEDVDGEKVLQEALRDYEDVGDVFTSAPHFFSAFVRSHLLPFVEKECVDSVANAEPAPLLHELRDWLRVPTIVADEYADGTPGEAPAVPHARVTAAKGTPCRRMVELLLGAAATSMLDGEAVCEASGLLRPCTPADVAALLASLALCSLMPGVVGPATQWLDRALANAAAQQHHPEDCEGGVKGTRAGASKAAAAMRRALGHCTSSLQVVPFPLCDGRDADTQPDVHVAGEWLLAAGSSQFTQVPDGGTATCGVRRAVVLPGLAIAVTHISSVAGAPLRTESTYGPSTIPDAGASAGSCVCAPTCALPALLWSDAHLDAASVVGPHLGEAVREASALLPTPVSCVPASHLQPVEWLLLFTSFPDDTHHLRSIEVAVAQTVASGWVVIAVQAAVAKATQALVESTWGTASRRVLLLSAVGKWGVQQLSLRFDVEPNTVSTDSRQLRGCLREKCMARGWCCGAAMLLLRRQAYASTLTQSDQLSAGVQDARARQRRRQRVVTELRDHYVCVLGAVPCDDVVAEEAAKMTAAHMPASSPVPQKDGGTTRTEATTLATQTMSMFHRDSVTSESDEGEEVASLAASDNDCSSSSNSSDFSTTAASEASTSPVRRLAAELVEWYDDAAVPPFPCVTHSVLIGATTRAAQRELVYFFWYWWRLLLHRLVLPQELGCAVATEGPLSADATVLRCLDAMLSNSGGVPSEGKDEALKRPSPQAARTMRVCELHFLRTLREALWSYALLAQQHGEDAQSLDVAWTQLQQWVSAEGESGARVNASSDVAAESWLQVRSAYVALAECLDELCSTAVVTTSAGSGELRFMPMV